MNIEYIPTVDLFELIQEIDRTYGTEYSKDALRNFAPECQANDSYFYFSIDKYFNAKEWAYWSTKGPRKDREKCTELVYDYLVNVRKLADNGILVSVSW